MLSVIPRYIAEEVAPVMRLADELTRWPALMSRYVAQPLDHLGESEVYNTDKQFCIRVDMHCFKPEEVKICSDNQRISVHAKHEEKQDDHGFVAREITRIYKLPDNVDARSVTSTMTDQGILNIKVDKKALEAPKEYAIPVEFK